MRNKIIFIILIIFLINFFEKRKYDIENNYIKPKISIFLPIYNKVKYLKRSITSIQKQSLKEIEIIPVNDCSTDNSLEILKDFAKKDSRIKIINNKKNYGLCFSRVMGILNSKGEYLMNLDPDDEYRGKNTLKDLYNLANKLKVDFISFFILSLPDRKKSFQFSNFNQIIQQPKLLESAFLNDHLIDFYITNKLIKRELLENVVKIFGNKIYEQKWNYHEDNIWSILLHKYANSSVFINKIVYFYYSKNSDSEMFNRGNNLEIKNFLFRNEMYQEIFKTKNEEKYIISGYSELLLFLEKNIKIIKENIETKYLCIKHLDNYKKKYNLSAEIRLKINNLIDIFAL
jgi:glycosyltransferase involved in cell wall biosynthesis